MIDIAGAVTTEAIDEETRDQPEPVHRAAGVGPVAAHYGDPMREQRTLATGVGLVDRSHRGVVAVPGEERSSWLHTLTSQHLAALGPWQGTELLVLSPHGHVDQHAMVTEDGETTWLDTEPGMTTGLLSYLERMRFFSKVEPRDATADHAVLSLVGPEAAGALDTLGVTGLAAPDVVAVPGPKFRSGELPPRPTVVYDVKPLPIGGWARRVALGVDLLIPREAMTQVVDELRGAGVPVAGLWAYEAVRVAARRARAGVDTDHRTIPAEVDLIAPAVHLDKGCYRGQETVARVHNLGKPPRRLVLLHLDGVTTDQPPVAGTPVTLDGRTVGFVGTAVHHYELGQIALAVVKRNVADDARLMVGETAAAIEPA
ncbi:MULTISPECIES: folate-binding protein YgfZ [Micromonospora]|uniref:Folate-binding protein n=1 Tax=Micromonospora solifontis TaxID=2487138 RepID=A0ABX9WIT8_9ACTN|nr:MULTISPECIES: glycine cleavage T C-terminal barrel domain-containing protein [Micromonospora]NES15668.1 folate-binding protein YgfZ [Micromonospora sp. PPF5-17B]NES35968.1 folate-binding protein YgfZ [Micromonospora solifontis]NES56959.1 folate-binding protein YgfZ [Micromonospora sp. PPF5-6]RNM00075.1 folate-binding protein [Micromonospora solifontis]